MLVQIRKKAKRVMIGLTCIVGMTLVSCATHKETALVNDPTGEQGSSIPWNKQEKWENTGPMAGLTDRR